MAINFAALPSQTRSNYHRNYLRSHTTKKRQHVWGNTTITTITELHICNKSDQDIMSCCQSHLFKALVSEYTKQQSQWFTADWWVSLYPLLPGTWAHWTVHSSSRQMILCISIYIFQGSFWNTTQPSRSGSASCRKKQKRQTKTNN